MKQILSRIWIISALLILNQSNLFAQGIQFEHDSTLALLKLKAKKANKPILIDCFTTWCGPCKWMAKNVFTNDTVGQFYNQNFICAKIDMEKGDGKNIALKYKIKGYPTLLYIDSSGKELHRGFGAQASREFILTGKKAIDPEKSFYAIKDNYKKGKRDPEFIRLYINEAMASGEEFMEVADWYFYGIKDSELFTKENFDILNAAITNHNQLIFTKFYNNRAKFAEVASKKEVNDKIVQIFTKSFNEAFTFQKGTDGKRIEKNNDEKYIATVNKIKTFGFEDEGAILGKVNLRYLFNKGDFTNYVVEGKKYFPKYAWQNENELNSYAWMIFEKFESKEALELGCDLSKRSIELNNNYAYNDTYANLLYKLKRKKEAQKYAQIAIDLAKKENQDATATVELLAQIKKLK